MALPPLIAFSTSFLVALLVVRTARWHQRFSMDSLEGVQKFHTRPTPRIGGVALLAGCLAALPAAAPGSASLLALVLACGSVAFLAGFAEDLSKSVSPAWRLAAALVSGALLVAFSDVVTPLLDPLLPAGTPAWLARALFALAGLGIAVALAGTTNAVNIIDGFHGLAAGSVIIMSLTIAALASMEGDAALAGAALLFAASVAGFMMVNFPGGYLFLGDAGAYLAGFILGALAVLLAARTDVSAFVSILVIAYPVYETLFSMVRKWRRPGYSPAHPDRVHLHMLVSRHFARFVAYGLDRPEIRNPLTGVMMWPFSLVASLLALCARGTNAGGILGLVIFALFYGRIYRITSLQSRSFLWPLTERLGWDETERFRRRTGKPGIDPSTGSGEE